MPGVLLTRAGTKDSKPDRVPFSGGEDSGQTSSAIWTLSVLHSADHNFGPVNFWLRNPPELSSSPTVKLTIGWSSRIRGKLERLRDIPKQQQFDL